MSGMGEVSFILLGVVAGMACVIVYQAVIGHFERKRSARAIDNLIDRLMAHDFNTYLAGNRAQNLNEIGKKRRSLREMVGWNAKHDQKEEEDGQTGTREDQGLPVN